MKAAATFTVRSWDEKPVLEPAGGGKCTRASIAGSYTGDVEGESTSENVMWYRADGTAQFTGFERIGGRLGGRQGSFVLRSSGAYDGTEARAAIEVVPGSGTDELVGLAGEGTFAAPHGLVATVELVYRFDS